MAGYHNEPDGTTAFERIRRPRPAGGNRHYYTQRDAHLARVKILQDIGFKTYSEYLASPLWKGIHRSVIRRDQGLCQVCRKAPALQVHHRKYTRQTLLGQDLQSLISICVECHRDAEIARSGKQLTTRSANNRMRRMSKTMTRSAQ